MKPYIRRGLTWSALMVAVMAGLFAWAWFNLPAGDRFPLHWNASGEADRFGDRGDALFALGLLPAISAAVAIFLAVWPQIDPRKRHLDQSRQAYLAIWVGVMTFMALLDGFMLWMMLDSVNPQGAGLPVEPIRLIMGGVSLLFLLVGNFLPKTRSSWGLGIRTPWTLSDENVWHRTHRLAGPLFMLAGLVGLVGAFIAKGDWITFSTLVPILGVTVLVVAYSYFVWRQEPRAGTDEG